MAYEYYGTDTVALPGRTVQTFPSGLVRVEQMYAVRKGMPIPFKSKQRFPEPDPSRLISFDGLYVFPDPEIVEDGDGFTKYKVTAYGRAKNIGTSGYEPVVIKGFAKAYYIQRNVKIINLTNSEGEIVGSDRTSRDFRFDSVNSTYSRIQIIPTTEIPDISTPLDNAEVLALAGPDGYFNAQISWQLVGVNSVYYGYWTEHTINFQALGVTENVSTGSQPI